MSKKASLKHSVSEDMMFERTNTLCTYTERTTCALIIFLEFSHILNPFSIYEKALCLFLEVKLNLCILSFSKFEGKHCLFASSDLHLRSFALKIKKKDNVSFKVFNLVIS